MLPKHPYYADVFQKHYRISYHKWAYTLNCGMQIDVDLIYIHITEQVWQQYILSWEDDLTLQGAFCQKICPIMYACILLWFESPLIFIACDITNTSPHDREHISGDTDVQITPHVIESQSKRSVCVITIHMWSWLENLHSQLSLTENSYK